MSPRIDGLPVERNRCPSPRSAARWWRPHSHAAKRAPSPGPVRHRHRILLGVPWPTKAKNIANIRNVASERLGKNLPVTLQGRPLRSKTALSGFTRGSIAIVGNWLPERPKPTSALQIHPMQECFMDIRPPHVSRRNTRSRDRRCLAGHWPDGNGMYIP